MLSRPRRFLRFPARLRGRARAGAGLWSALLAIALTAGAMLAYQTYRQAERQDAQAVLAARQLALLSEAAREHAQDDFATLLAAADREITFAAISANLPDGFPTADAMGRGWRILKRPAGTDAFAVLVTQTVPAGDGRAPLAGLLASTAAVRLGMVRPTDLRLTGAALDADLAAWRTAFPGAAPARALATLLRVDRSSVCGPWLHRQATAACPDSGRMTVALDLGGNDITAAGTIEANSLDLDQGLAVAGTASFEGEVTLARSLSVTGDVTVTGAVSAGTATLAGAVSAASVTVDNALTVGTSLNVGGRATAASVASTGTLSAAGLTASTATVSGVMTVGSCSGC